MKKTIVHFFATTFSTLGLFFLTSCDIDKTADGEMPDVDVDVAADPGKLPEFEVRGPDVDAETKTVEVEVPTVDIDLPEEEENEPNNQ